MRTDFLRIPILKKRLFLIIFLSLNFTFSQTLHSKKELERLFKKSILQPKKSIISIGENSWKICMDKDNTEIYLYETKFEKHSNCCRYMNWTFYKKNKFIKNESYDCSEPPLSKVTTEDDWYEIEFIESNNLILIIKNKIKTEKYIVKEIQKRKDNLHIITLIKL
ncbi:hypothetical protein ACLB9Y_12550 [Chryseobacterium scophthalmum]|uniref:hypothetical protein n=1 Tax=Chryseobacterium scophthalmum TaxID=59733 RepID=UPI00398ADD0A